MDGKGVNSFNICTQSYCIEFIYIIKLSHFLICISKGLSSIFESTFFGIIEL
jgi:hypothetical protein